MKQKRVSVMMIGATVLLALMAGCATTRPVTQDTANMLVAAGFKTIMPKTTAQQQKLHQLSNWPGSHDSKKRGNLLHLSRPPASKRGLCGWTVLSIRLINNSRSKAPSQENVQTAAVYQDTSMHWNTWGGWGVGWGRMGHVGGVGRVGGVGL